MSADLLSVRRSRWRLSDFGVSPAREALIRKAIAERWNVLICGTACCGKTRFLNACLSLARAGERLLVVEEAREVEFEGEHVRRITVGVPGPDGQRVEYRRAAKKARQHEPDRVVMGEVGHDSCQTAVRILADRQQGFLSTIEADSPALALDTVARTLANAGEDERQVHDTLCTTVDIVVLLNRVPGTEPWVADIRRLSPRAVAFDPDAAA
ncbi:ATPase, T2SS/T4P/T4SS family [Marinibaculum pumilum]|uniref:ATPase, T2SS/T4P/T4SS family n=1 Tax=Marinibaculum pumilum TaxID=1766165 RepID=A0ABV7L528_9PROT